MQLKRLGMGCFATGQGSRKKGTAFSGILQKEKKLGDPYYLTQNEKIQRKTERKIKEATESYGI